MKKITYLVIMLMLASLSSCAVRRANNLAMHYENTPYNRWVLSGNSHTFSRPPIN